MNTPVLTGDIIELTEKQRHVLVLMAKGLEEKQIALEKRIAISTVKQYKQSIFKNLGAVNAAHAVAIGKNRGLI